MQKTNVNTALAIAFIALAVMIIGGLAAMPSTTTVMADKPDFWYCAHGSGGVHVCSPSESGCEFARGLGDIEGRCHLEPRRF